MTQPLNILITAGGTGGHIFPGLACAEAATSRSHQVSWIGTAAGMEKTLVPKHDIPFFGIETKGLRGKSVVNKVSAVWKAFYSTIQAMRLIRQLKPHVVIGFGGYVCGPVGLAAVLSGKPLLIHEQNAVAGLTNRLLARFSKKVFQAFPGALDQYGAATVGNPVRESIRASQAKEYASREKPYRLLVLGGSLGAQKINQELPLACQGIDEDVLEIRHQCGKGNEQKVKDNYASVNRRAEVSGFIDDMDAALAWADFVICRAGALTVSEITEAKLPALFIPFPYAVDDHQTKNASHLSQIGAAKILQEKDMNENLLREMVQSFLSFETLQAMQTNIAETIQSQDTSGMIVDACEEVVYG